jgi:Cu/Ag efflux protein CusF
MGTARILLASAAAISVLASTAFAEDNLVGTITRINRINNTIAIRETPGGTVGNDSEGLVREFKAKDSGMLEDVHAGDQVSFSTTGNDEARTITKLEKAKP